MRLSLAFPIQMIMFQVELIRIIKVIDVFMGGVMVNCGLSGGMKLLIKMLSKCFRLSSCIFTIELASNDGGFIRCHKWLIRCLNSFHPTRFIGSFLHCSLFF